MIEAKESYENEVAKLDTLKDLKERVQKMEPIACGHEHENRIVQLRDNGEMHANFVEQKAFCSDSNRIQNPACAHCFLFDSARGKIKALHPSLIPDVTAYTKDRKTALLANPFAVEFIQSQRLGVRFTKEEVLDLFSQAETILSKRETRVLQYDDSRFRDLLNGLIEKMCNVSADSLERHSIQSLIDERYMSPLRKAIAALDGIATEDSRDKLYDKETIVKYQNVIIELLKNLQKFMLVGIHRHIEELNQ